MSKSKHSSLTPDFILRAKATRRLHHIEELQAAENNLYEKRLAAFHWMKQNGIQAIDEPTDAEIAARDASYDCEEAYEPAVASLAVAPLAVGLPTGDENE